jgi:hypothetical protein
MASLDKSKYNNFASWSSKPMQLSCNNNQTTECPTIVDTTKKARPREMNNCNISRCCTSSQIHLPFLKADSDRVSKQEPGSRHIKQQENKSPKVMGTAQSGATFLRLQKEQNEK